MHMLLAGMHRFMYIFLAHTGRYVFFAHWHTGGCVFFAHWYTGGYLLFEICWTFQRYRRVLNGKPTNYEAQGLGLAKTLAPREHVLNLDALSDGLATHTLPVYERSRLSGEIPLGEDVVREVRQTLTLEGRQVETDALGRGDMVEAMHVFIVHPNGLGNVRYINKIG